MSIGMQPSKRLQQNLLSGEWTFTHGGALLRVKHVERRLTRGSVVYGWEPIPGGMLDRFETQGMPADLKKAPA